MERIQDVRRAMYRQQLLAAAEQEFSQNGFTGAKMESIASTAGVSLSTVYKTFAGKLDLWNALHAERMAALLASVRTATTESTSPLERLLDGIAAVARFLCEHDNYLAMNLRAEFGWASNAADGRGVQRTVWSTGLETIVAAIEAALTQGEIRPIRPRIAAGMVVSALQVWLSDWVGTGHTRPAEVMIAELTQRLRWILVGITV